jgi:hypothetical protein
MRLAMGCVNSQPARTSRRRRPVGLVSWSSVAVPALLACGGCQSLVTSALPGRFALGEDARIAKQARADSFPSPADVGIESATVTR